MLTENDILWNLTKPLSQAHMDDYNDDGELRTTNIPASILNIKKKYKKW